MAQFFKRLTGQSKPSYVIDESTEISNLLRSISESNRNKLSDNVRNTLARNLNKTQYELNMSIAKQLSNDTEEYYIDCIKKNKTPDFLNYFLTISKVQSSIRQKFNEYYTSASNIITLKNIPDIPDMSNNIVKTKEFKELISGLSLFLEYFRDLYGSNINKQNNKKLMFVGEVYDKIKDFTIKYTDIKYTENKQNGGRNQWVNTTNTYKYKMMKLVAQFIELEYRLASSKSLFIIALILAPFLLICVFFYSLLYEAI